MRLLVAYTLICFAVAGLLLEVGRHGWLTWLDKE